MKAFIETWQINQKMNQFLLDGINENHLADRSTFKGRSVGEQFAHIHNVRLMWVKVAAPLLLSSQKKFEKEDLLSRQTLSEQLQQSSQAIKSVLEEGLTTGRVKGFKPHPEAFLGLPIPTTAIFCSIANS